MGLLTAATLNGGNILKTIYAIIFNLLDVLSDMGKMDRAVGSLDNLRVVKDRRVGRCQPGQIRAPLAEKLHALSADNF